ncbi:low molecular weight phosphatase family protein [Agrococcus sp. ARC_14]|uniref:arsenate reductase/protein-tyrosine-phosphatase family protein n=1 Tax=Agrococcus sp. ARC_14 TaxID=2919927 RepID=UPI001F0662B7|nr:low molecular weight phosphatase family protein [Agrococcus sp. ARC_14]MCH1884311.1 low molecular weight phosphatase family protein [Agrococcus sp. ARC_14]
MPRHAESTHPSEAVFRILTVCTGNICRSPQAEQLLRARLPAALPGAEPGQIEVTSAGTMARDGDSMEQHAAAEAVRLGVADAAAHRARRLLPAQVQEADLVLGLAQEHRGAAVRAVPRVNHRAFTLIEFTRVVEALADGSAARAVEPLGADGVVGFLHRVVAAAEVRGLMPQSLRQGIDIDDPYGRSAAVYRRSADAVAEHVDRLAAALGALARG